MNSYFFRVEHDLLRSEAFKTLGGSAIKVYLVIGLYSDFGTDWAYPSIRTIARQAGLSRQTVLAAIEQLTRIGLLATSKAKGRSTAYRIIRQAPRAAVEVQAGARRREGGRKADGYWSKYFRGTPSDCPRIFRGAPLERSKFLDQSRPKPFGPPGPEVRPEREPASIEDATTSIPIPGTPFRLTAEGRLLVAVDLQELLTNQGIPGQLAQRLLPRRTRKPSPRCCSTRSISRARASSRTAPAISGPGSRTATTSSPRWPAGWKPVAASWKPSSGRSPARQQQAREVDQQAAEEAAIAY